MYQENIIPAFILVILAGLATGIGSAIAFFAKRTNTRFLAIALGFSAGVMIYVSFVEIMAKARTALTDEFGATGGAWMTALAFFGGMAVVACIDRLVPQVENPHEMHMVEEMRLDPGKVKDEKLMRMGLLTALAIGIHNFPEGIATFVATLKSPSIGLPIAIAIGIHNIPEGIAVSVPIYYATGSKRKAFTWSVLSGLAEPLGALLAFLILMPFLNNLVFGILFGAVAGIMVFISFDQLLPSAEEYGEHHLTIYGTIIGMGVMAFSLLLFL
jgi:zinc transporter, ZIP family